MYFTLMIVCALVAVVLVLLLERSGDPRLLERDYYVRARTSKKGPSQ